MKDPGAGFDHGEFTHMIQWIMIGYQNEDMLFLSDSLLKTYQSMGSEALYNVIKIPGEYAEETIWDRVIDCSLKRSKGERDFRSPDRLCSFLSETT